VVREATTAGIVTLLQHQLGANCLWDITKDNSLDAIYYPEEKQDHFYEA